MTNNRDRIKVNKKEEERTKEISKMIDEGGLGADHYYEIKRTGHPKKDQEDED